MKIFIWDSVPIGINFLNICPLTINAVQIAPTLYALRESLKREIDETIKNNTKHNTYRKGLQAMIDFDPSHVIDGERAYKNQLTREELVLMDKFKIKLDKLKIRGHNV